MFLGFKIKKHNSKNSSSESDSGSDLKPKSKVSRNLRFFKRYSLEKHQSTIVYEQDILLVRNISYDGFCLKVSQRLADSLKVGQSCYFKNFKLNQKHTSIYAQIIWINSTEALVGYLVDKDRSIDEYHKLIEPILLPQDIASSFRQIDIKTYDSVESGIKTLFYKGTYNSEICLKYQKIDEKDTEYNSKDSSIDIVSSYFEGYKLVEVLMFSSNIYLKWYGSGVQTGTFSYNDSKDQKDSNLRATDKDDSTNKKESSSNIIYLAKNKEFINKSQAGSSSSCVSFSSIKDPYLISLSSINFIPCKNPCMDHISFFNEIISTSNLLDKNTLLKIFGNYPSCCGINI